MSRVPLQAVQQTSRRFLSSARFTASSWPDWLVAELRSDHAGECGAVMIYRGILSISRDKEVRSFAIEHLETEQKHVNVIETILPEEYRTRLLPVWRVAGWITGALPAFLGPRWVFATIDAVETFVDHHYQAQIDKLEPNGEHGELRQLLVDCQADEVHHRDDARNRVCGDVQGLLKGWQWLVRVGSDAAVFIARRV
eukprot:m.346595 g.346595  ORF g.346595 m.346595 type:complete len:197 (+) comp29605_c0_seq1:239-829(+)